MEDEWYSDDVKEEVDKDEFTQRDDSETSSQQNLVCVDDHFL